MPWAKGTAGIYENYLNNLGSYLGQQEVNTGRSATPEMMYGATSGALSPLLQYDIQRRKILAETWLRRHEANKSNSGGTFGGILKGVAGLGMMFVPGGQLAGAGMLASSTGDLLSKKSAPVASGQPAQTTSPDMPSGDDFWELFRNQPMNPGVGV